ncbi:MAG: hypothetical protein HC881_16960 [Leptolyngbyaceae cyanobacterium SL_7_1]|nr:hypothetical protein [Leptolyngbyaceae cyanobacterium SL_7_1]
MLSASAELITLCRSQVALLTQGLGASLTIVYLTEELADALDTKLVPIVAHPEVAATWEPDEILSLFANQTAPPSAPIRLLSPADAPNSSTVARRAGQGNPVSPSPLVPAFQFDQMAQQEVVLPLIHDEAMVGLLVTARSDRPWNPPEQTQIEQIAQTLAIACVLDQRGQWLEHDRQQYQLQQAQQRDTVDTLLHQFAIPDCPALLGKLLMRRLQLTDGNRDVAESIVRESDRLQDLLRQLETTLETESVDLLPAIPVPNSPWQLPPPAAIESSPSRLPEAGYLTGAALHREPHALLPILEPVWKSAEAIAPDRQLTLHLHSPPTSRRSW